MAKATYQTVYLVNEEHPENGVKYMAKVSTKGQKASSKLRLRKYDPVLKGHYWFIQKKLPSHSKK